MPRDVIEFPDELRVEDDAVNAFIEKAIQTCADGDYEAFRLLWSAKREPISERQYVQGGRAAQRITIERIQRFLDTNDKIAYGVRAHIELDPREVPQQDETERDIVLLVVQENDRWCLTHAPRNVRDVLKQVDESPDVGSSGAASVATSQPADATP